MTLQPDQSRPPLPAGTFVAPGYEVVGLLSRNQVFDVYDVWSAERDCRCVAKTLRPDCPDAARMRARLLQEGRLLQQMTHPHLVRAYETLEVPRPVVVLETLTGPTLSQLIATRNRRLAVIDLAFLGLHLCSAMHYLHGRGFLHLDLKPANVINSGGLAKVIDLSLARPPGRGRPGVGTIDYLAPEQTLGDELTTATDVWGIAVTLFEAATGALPLDHAEPGGGADERARATANGREYPQPQLRARPVGSLRRVPRPLAAAIDACLATQPAARPSVLELAAALDALLPVDTRPCAADEAAATASARPLRKIRGAPCP